MDLSRLLRRIGRLDEAQELARAATDSARRLDLFPILVNALEGEAACALAKGDAATAIALASEAVAVIKTGKLYDSMRAGAMINHARCLVANGDLAGAESDLAASWELLQAPTPFRPILSLASWWEVKSQLLEKQGILRSAREAITQVIEYRRQLQSPAFGLMEALERLAELSQRLGDLPGCESALAEAKAIRSDLRLPEM
jgi:tetratricopeptide (TPR) repeat protein